MEYEFQTPVQKIVEMRRRESTADTCTNFMCVLGDACATLFDRFGLDGTERFEEACQLLSGTGDATSSESVIVRVERLVGEKSSLTVINQRKCQKKLRLFVTTFCPTAD